jgi:hypothetical protein
MVPDEGIEPPTFGLQNRCSTAELIRRVDDLAWNPSNSIDHGQTFRQIDVGLQPTNMVSGACETARSHPIADMSGDFGARAALAGTASVPG